MPAFTKLRRSLSIASLLGLSLGLTACGYKAPLYYPTQEQLQQIEARDQRIKARKQAAKEAAQKEREQARAREQEQKTGIPQ
ncbi:LPS translocon maturation chaperone LptM [Advenella sp. RU8]|mgnify:CR=1 FL=1|uniref:LPS translocon maturation chaperone LptM n=1 Tax=Advenella sp. RU8 TaxID=3399575 RepID=UPI003AB0076A